MEKQIIKKGKNMYINVSDQNMDYNPKFCLYLTSRSTLHRSMIHVYCCVYMFCS